MSLPEGYKHSAETVSKIRASLAKRFAEHPRRRGYTVPEDIVARRAAGIRRAFADGRRSRETPHLAEWQTADRLAVLRPLGIEAMRLSRSIPPADRVLNDRRCRYISSANARGIEWALSRDEFYGLVKQPCWYCGAEPSQCTVKHPEIKFNGVDRLDSSRGYKAGNVVPCCALCNLAKSDTPLDEFLEMARRIASRHPHGADASSKRDIRTSESDHVATCNDVAVEGCD